MKRTIALASYFTGEDKNFPKRLRNSWIILNKKTDRSHIMIGADATEKLGMGMGSIYLFESRKGTK